MIEVLRGFSINYLYLVAATAAVSCDIFTGVTGAIVRKEFTSSGMREGGAHKLAILNAFIFALAADFVFFIMGNGLDTPCVELVSVYVSFMELMSCMENIEKTRPGTLPKALVKALKQSAQNAGVELKDQEE